MLAHPLNPWFLLALIHILIACLRLLAICQILLPHLASLRFEFFLLLPLLYYFSCLKWSEITSHKHRFPSQKTNQIERNRYILYLFIARFFCTDYFFFLKTSGFWDFKMSTGCSWITCLSPLLVKRACLFQELRKRSQECSYSTVGSTIVGKIYAG